MSNILDDIARLYDTDESPPPYLSRFTGFTLRHRNALRYVGAFLLLAAVIVTFVAWGRFLDEVRMP